jgi:hypothetical protein
MNSFDVSYAEEHRFKKKEEGNMKSKGTVFGIMVVAGAAAALAVAGMANAAVLKGTGKASISVIATSGGHGNNSIDVKPAGTVSAKPAPAKAGAPPTGGAIFSAKLAKDVGDPTKPGFPDGAYVLEAESSATPTGDVVGSILAASFYIRFDIAGGKCTVQTNPHFDTGGDMCGGMGQPLCAPAGVGKCAATIYQVAGEALTAAMTFPGDPFFARFRVRTAPATGCNTGDTCINGAGGICAPLTTTCHNNPVIAVGGVALAPFGF